MHVWGIAQRQSWHYIYEQVAVALPGCSFDTRSCLPLKLTPVILNDSKAMESRSICLPSAIVGPVLLRVLVVSCAVGTARAMVATRCPYVCLWLVTWPLLALVELLLRCTVAL